MDTVANLSDNSLDVTEFEKYMRIELYKMDSKQEGPMGKGIEGFQEYMIDLDQRIQQRINRGIEEAIKIVMKKTIKFIDNRMITHNSEQVSKLDAIEAKFVRKNIELKRQIQEVEK